MKSSTRNSVRCQLTAAILAAHDLDPAVTVDQALVKWFHNQRHNGGLRLTAAGLQDFLRMNINSWSHDMGDRRLGSRDLLALDCSMKWPYFIDKKKNRILFFGGKEAMMAMLYNDVSKWLENMQNTAKR